MSIMELTYDLRKPGRNYETLYTAIRAFGTYAKATESTWFVETNLSAGETLGRLRPHVDANDVLTVNECGSDWAFMNLSTDVAKWLTDRLKAKIRWI